MIFVVLDLQGLCRNVAAMAYGLKRITGQRFSSALAAWGLGRRVPSLVLEEFGGSGRSGRTQAFPHPTWNQIRASCGGLCGVPC